MDKEMLVNLSAAVSNGRTDIVRTLVNLYETHIKECGSEWTCKKVLSSPCNSFGTLLHLATKLDHVDIVRTLLCSGADPNVQNTLGETPFDLVQSQNMTTAYVDELLKCSAKSELDRICQLVNAGVDVNTPDSPESGNRALHWAVCFGKPQAVQCLLDLGALPNVVNGQGATPLHEAVKRKNIDILTILLAAGADPAIKSTSGKYFGKTPLDLAEANSPVAALLSQYVPNNHHLDNEETNKPDVSTVSEIVENDLSSSMQSLSTLSDLSVKPNVAGSSYVPRSPSFAPLPLITDSKLHLLWPQPQKIVQTDGPPFRLEAKHAVHIVRGTLDSSCVSKLWETFAESCRAPEFVIEDVLGPQSISHGSILFHASADLFPRPESYKLVISGEQIRILASDVLGAHYALCTLGQLLHLYSEDEELPSLFIHDWPQLQHRAVLLDLSVDVRKPNMETLKCLVQTMSLLKLKQLHCYFRYDLISSDLPYPSRDLLELHHFCLEHRVQIVPAIDVHSRTRSFSEIGSLLPQPIQRLVNLFSSRSLELGPNLSKLILEEMASADNPQFLSDFLPLPLSTLYVCCSGLRQCSATDLLRILPLNCVLVDYAYQVEYDYDFNAKFYSEAGYNVCIGTGTKTWGSIAGIPETTVSSIHKASQASLSSGSSGLIVADWKTLPHHPALCFSWPGILVALGMAWNCNVHEDYLRARLSELLNLWVWRDASGIAGYLNVELGRLETFVHQSLSREGDGCQTSVLHQLIRDPDSVLLDHFTQDILQQASRHLKKFEIELQKCDPVCTQHGEVLSELRLAIDFLLFACRLGRVMVSTGLNPSGGHSCGLAVINVGVSNLPPISRTDLANRLLALTEQYRAVWLSRNLPCGLQTSLRVFSALLQKLVPESEHNREGIDAFLLPPSSSLCE